MTSSFKNIKEKNLFYTSKESPQTQETVFLMSKSFRFFKEKEISFHNDW